MPDAHVSLRERMNFAGTLASVPANGNEFSAYMTCRNGVCAQHAANDLASALQTPTLTANAALAGVSLVAPSV
jgi:hypothetical protein